MLRDQSLIPLSHQHHHALAICVRIERAVQAGEFDVEAWQTELQQSYEQEIRAHFAAEEEELFPLAGANETMRGLVRELADEHAMLRACFEQAAQRAMTETDLQTFATKLAAHIRKEERQLFEEMQRAMSTAELSALGVRLAARLTQVNDACELPTGPTRLLSRKEIERAKHSSADGS